MTINIMALVVAFLVALVVLVSVELMSLFVDLYDEEMGDKDEYNNKV